MRAMANCASGLGLLIAVAGFESAHAAEGCAWEARIPEATTAEGHRVSVIFSSFMGQQVRLQVADQPMLEKTLTTAEWSAAYSGSVQCRLEGPTHFILIVDDRTTSLYLNVDGPLQIYVSPGKDGLHLALHETDMDGFLLD